MKKEHRKKLLVKKESVRTLSSVGLAKIVGGLPDPKSGVPTLTR
jgi:hypothetical protein